MPNAIATYADLLAALAALPPPPPGTVRVYRGQTKDYPTLTPSGLRKSPRKQAIWQAYCGLLYRSLVAEAFADGGTQSLQAFALWFNALAQHYGPGSDFLDVTHSLEAALWFALNKATAEETTGVIGPSGPPDPTRDHLTRGEQVRYDRWNEAGYIYVFDLPVWDGEGLPVPGVIVDLAAAPPVFSSSRRMQVQAGCLVNCRNPDGTPLDVRALLVPGSPLAVQRPLSGAPGTVPFFDSGVASIYPSPAEDAWYARLLSVPMIYAPDPAPPALDRAIPVTIYFDEGNPQYLNEVTFFDVALPTPLVHRNIPAFVGPAITLEAPFVFPYPPADSPDWHQGLLWSDLPDRCPLYEFGQTGPCGTLPLDNVLFEFSLLEDVGWERVVLHRETIPALRGVWLRRAGEEWEAAFVHQTMPGGDPQVRGFLRLRYDVQRKCIVAVLADGNEPALVDFSADYAKAVFVGLMLLRHLSPVIKCEPLPIWTTAGESEDATPLYQMMAGVAGDAAHAYRVKAPAPNPDWYVLRQAGDPQEPFTHVKQRVSGLGLESRQRFGDFPIEDIVRNLPQ